MKPATIFVFLLIVAAALAGPENESTGNKAMNERDAKFLGLFGLGLYGGLGYGYGYGGYGYGYPYYGGYYGGYGYPYGYYYG